jgi:hypothetical protein
MFKVLTLAVSCAVLVAGCAVGHAPVVAPLTIVKGPVSAGPAATSPKVGKSEAWVSSCSRRATQVSRLLPQTAASPRFTTSITRL